MSANHLLKHLFMHVLVWERLIFAASMPFALNALKMSWKQTWELVTIIPKGFVDPRHWGINLQVVHCDVYTTFLFAISVRGLNLHWFSDNGSICNLNEIMTKLLMNLMATWLVEITATWSVEITATWSVEIMATWSVEITATWSVEITATWSVEMMATWSVEIMATREGCVPCNGMTGQMHKRSESNGWVGFFWWHTMSYFVSCAAETRVKTTSPAINPETRVAQKSIPVSMSLLWGPATQEPL